MLEAGEFEGRAYAIERRLPGRSILEELGHLEGPARAQVIEAYLETSAALGDLRLPAHDGYGDLIAEDAIMVSTWRAYLEERAARNLGRSTSELREVDPVGIADGLPEPADPSYVHLDAFAGNFLTDGLRVTAVLDFGPTSLAGDRRLDPIASVVYLASPPITPTAIPRDVDVAMSWLRSAGLAQWVEPARRWLAAYWSAAVGDPTLLAWCRSVLLSSEPSG